jgi:hypothetical protein
MDFSRKRHLHTLDLVRRFIPKGASILDVGFPNAFSETMRIEGWTVRNTDFDLDRQFDRLHGFKAEAATAFEILEHLIQPASVLTALDCKLLIASVPIAVWFSRAHWPENEWDQHYHEFEPRQFDKLIRFSGFEIIHRETWRHGLQVLGGRPLLRLLWPSYYAIVAKKIGSDSEKNGSQA